MSLTDPLVTIVSVLTRKVAEMQAIDGVGFSDLTMRQVYYLDLIGKQGNPTPTELARALKISKPSVSVAVERLAESGYVRKVQSDKDRRSFHLHLTEKAEQILGAHEKVHARIAEYLTLGLNEKELQHLTSLVNTILQAIQEKESVSDAFVTDVES